MNQSLWTPTQSIPIEQWFQSINNHAPNLLRNRSYKCEFIRCSAGPSIYMWTNCLLFRPIPSAIPSILEYFLAHVCISFAHAYSGIWRTTTCKLSSTSPDNRSLYLAFYLGKAQPTTTTTTATKNKELRLCASVAGANEKKMKRESSQAAMWLKTKWITFIVECKQIINAPIWPIDLIYLLFFLTVRSVLFFFSSADLRECRVFQHIWMDEKDMFVIITVTMTQREKQYWNRTREDDTRERTHIRLSCDLDGRVKSLLHFVWLHNAQWSSTANEQC